MSDVYKELRQVEIRDVIVGKKCDVCHKDIPPTERYSMKTFPYYKITTHHSDWGNDSVESFKYYHACSPECALKFATEYITNCYNGRNSNVIEIEHHNGWFMPEGVKDDEAD